MYLRAILLDNRGRRFRRISVRGNVIIKIIDRIKSVGFVSPKCIDRIAHRTNAIAAEIVGRISHANHFIFHIGKSDIHPVGKIFPYFILPSQRDFPTFVLNLTGILVGFTHPQHIGKFHFQQNIVGILNEVIGRQRQTIIQQIDVQSDISHLYGLPRENIVRCLALLHGRGYLPADRHVGGRRLNQSHIRI